MSIIRLNTLMMAKCVFSLLTIVIVTIAADDPVVSIAQGRIYGTLSTDGSYEKFEGIPYAEPPLGGKRFRPPVTPANWNETFYANRTGIQCPQFNPSAGNVGGTEDCLILNVYRQKPCNDVKKQSVMVFIHGGALNSGNSQTYRPDFLIPHGVILVTINYRLSILGFLCRRTKNIPGNAGLKDQRAALRWVQENINAFGGDTNSITIFGESAGALSVEMQTLSDSTGLFHKAIIKSGSAIAGWALDRKPLDRVNTIANMLGANTSYESLTKFYQNVDYKKLIEANMKYDALTYPLVPSYVCIEKPLEKTEPFLTDYPENLIKSGRGSHLDVISGFNSAEGLFVLAFSDPKVKFNTLIQNFSQYLPRDLCFNSEETKADVVNITRQFYFGDGGYNNGSVVQYIDYFTDTIFLSSMVRSLEARIKKTNALSFFYEFSYEGQRNLKNYLAVSGPGASHGDEVPYLFEINLPFPKPPSANDQIMINRMTKMWTNHAKFGNPTPDVSTLLPTKWIPVSEESLNTLIINLNMTMQIRPLQQRIAFWDMMYKSYPCETKI